jgi:NAD-specific glutamate dehydrogenase
MEDQNKDLPLIISEILIEMHEMKDEIRAMQGDIKSMTVALNRTAEVVLNQQAHTNNILTVFQEESKKNMEFMTYSIAKALGQQQAVNQDFESRLKRLEQQYQ